MSQTGGHTTPRRVRDLDPAEVRPGLRVRSLRDPSLWGTVVRVDRADDDFAWIVWDGHTEATGGFYGNRCDCEVAV